jgi:beta-glucanase (GH16 family)
MKRALLLLVTVCCSVVLAAQYSLVFSDEFEGTSLDSTRWNIQSGYAANQELEYYTTGNQNLRVENGNLVIVAKKENAVNDRNYSSGRINSKGKGTIRYGKVEARIYLPSGRGTWPAFWMMPQANVYGGWPYSGEIDIMEHIGSDPRMTSHAVHTGNKNGAKGNNWFNRQYKDSMENKFHTYAIVWGADDIKFYIDDVKSTTLYRNFTEDFRGWPFDQDFYLILNLAIGGTMGGAVDDAIFNQPVEMKVDYVRAYQLNTAIETIKTNNIEVYPTHFTNELNIKSTSPTVVSLFNGQGKLILNKMIVDTELINTSSLSNGIYLLKTEEGTFKLIK